MKGSQQYLLPGGITRSAGLMLMKCLTPRLEPGSAQQGMLAVVPVSLPSPLGPSTGVCVQCFHQPFILSPSGTELSLATRTESRAPPSSPPSLYLVPGGAERGLRLCFKAATQRRKSCESRCLCRHPPRKGKPPTASLLYEGKKGKEIQITSDSLAQSFRCGDSDSSSWKLSV